MSIAGTIQSSRKFNMRANSLDWPYPAENGYDAFAEPVSARQIMNWVIALAASMDEHFECFPGADVRSLLHEAIQRGLDARKDNQTMGTEEIVKLPSTVAEVSVVEGQEPMSVPPSLERPKSKIEDPSSEFDMSQFVDFDAGQDEDAKSISMAIHDKIKQSSDDFGNDIEDDMLLDL